MKELMDEKGISQNKLAHEIGVSQSQIARWLSNENKPTVDCLIMLSKYFKCSIDYLVGIVD